VDVLIGTEFGLRRRGAARHILAAVLALQAVVIVVVIASERASRRTSPARMVIDPGPHVWTRANPPKPVLRPPILAATEATMPPDEAVIGVEVGGKTRAYRLAAFDDDTRHLVNDLIGGVPVSVAYCNLTRCVRVYTDPGGSEPLDAEVPGLFNGQMVIKLDGIAYFHQSGMAVEPAKNPPPIPYRLLTPTLTTWKEWTRLHPETDVYVGGR
jgi:hypothetical protein